MNEFCWGKKSVECMKDLSPVLCRVLNRALGYGIVDMAIAQTIRGQYEQDTYYSMGLSQVKWPNSKHNVSGDQKYARAVDIFPWVNGGTSTNQLHVAVMIGVLMAAAAEEGIAVRSGSNWNGNEVFFTDETWIDGFHLELM